MAGLLDDPSTGVSHDGYDLPSQNDCAAPRPSSYESSGSMSATSARCFSSGEFVSKAPIAGSSDSQMLSSHTLTQSGVGVNSRCRGTSIGDTCTVFCAEGYQAVSKETSALTCVCDRCANPRCLSFGIDCSECFRIIYNETCIVRCLVGDTGVDDNDTTELKGDSDGHLQDSLGCAEESRALAGPVLLRDDHFTRIDSNVSGTQVQTTAACSLWHKGRVEPPSRKWRTKRLFNTKWRVSGVSYEVAKDGRQRTDRTR